MVMLLPKYPKVELNPTLQARLIATALRAADAASVPTKAHFRQALDVENKERPGSFDPVTIADRQAEQAIKKVVLDEFPEHGFFGEESERSINPKMEKMSFLVFWNSLYCKNDLLLPVFIRQALLLQTRSPTVQNS